LGKIWKNWAGKMHLAFIPYGIKNFVDFVVEDLNHKYLPLKLTKEGEKDKYILIQIQVRFLPFGIYELVFPKEFLNEILSAMKADAKGEYYERLNKSVLGIKPMDILRKVLKLKPVPEFDKIPYPNFPLPKYMEFVSIIPIGIREDGEITEKSGPYEGWTHEAI